MFIEPLHSSACTLLRAGGKGANLSVLIRSGFPVPDGFVVTTDAYRRLVDPLTIPAEIANAIRGAYQALGQPAVAVRSSATTEDLPDMSFAGQHETVLDVVSEEALLDAVLRCWSSFGTARALDYRSRHGIDHHDLAMAVVVQRMVPSEFSGVLFTANPVTGKRTETIVEATQGLGDALVSGRVEPDRYAVRMPDGEIVSRTLSSRRDVVRDDVIVDVARLGERAAALFGSPQDIEWAFAAGKLWLLQSRPITSLYPLPDGVAAEPLKVFFSVGAVQGMLDPFTPLGQDVLRLSFAPAMARRLGFEIDPHAGWPVVVAGERLFVNVTPGIRIRAVREWMRGGLALVEPGMRAALDRLPLDQPLAKARLPIRRFMPWRTAAVAVWLPLNILLNLLRPSARAKHLLQRADEAVAALEAERSSVRTLAGVLMLCDHALEMTPRILVPYLSSGIAAGIGVLQLLQRLAGAVPGGQELALEATRGLPHNVTTEMDLALWRAAQDPSGRAIDDFLARYGLRGVAEVDIGRPRWREDPSPLQQTIESYRRLPPEQAPDAVFSRGAAAAEATLERLEAELRKRPGGWWRAPLARWAGSRMRTLAGLREAPKFFVIRVLGVVRQALLAEGGPDIFFLRLDEVRALASGDARDFTTVIPERRAVYEREKRRRRVPRVLLSTGEAFYGGEGEPADADERVLMGTGVSPGVVEGAARIVFDPYAAQLAPGEILVCRATDPAWTPLFLVAGGLVTEVGGLLTHGSVVAREYGIPAVVGVHEATTRLIDGQRVRIDGSGGRVTVLP